MDSKAELKRQLILDTAKQIILDHDFHALTLDAVAKQAGISKGGLLYHFPNKDALIKGLVAYIFEEVCVNFHKYAENDSNKKGKWTRAFIEASKHDLEHNAALNIGVFVASLLDPEVSKNISDGYQSILARLEQDGINPLTATIIRLALDGLYYSQMLHIAPLDKERQNEVIQQLVRMTREDS